MFPQEASQDEINQNITSWAWALPTAWNIWKQTALNRRTVPDILRSYRTRTVPAYEHALEGVQFAYELDLNHKRANGLRAALITYNPRASTQPHRLSKFGLDLTYAMNHYAFADHGMPHVRRTHRVMDQVVLRVPELRHAVSIRYWLPALELFPFFHDADQVLTLQRNRYLFDMLKKKGEIADYERLKLKPKTGHAEAASVMIMALQKRYLEESGMSGITDEDRRAVMGAALMILKHDEPDRIDEAFSATMGKDQRRKAQGSANKYKRKAHGNQHLLEDYESNSVDLFSLSPHQIMKILKAKKASGNFLSDQSIYGLDPHFEKEYHEELQALFEDKNPVFKVKELSDSDRKSFILATKAAVFADEVEMIYPPYPSILRSLRAEVSRPRPFWVKDATAEDIFQIMTDAGGNYRGPLASDAYRLLWETWQIIEKTRLAKVNSANSDVFEFNLTPYVVSVAREHILMRLFALREFGVRIMGDHGSAIFLTEIFNERKTALLKKAIRRSTKIGTLEKALHLAHPDYDKLKETLDSEEDTVLSDRLSFRIRTLIEEEDEIRQILNAKPYTGQYSEKDILEFSAVCDRLIHDAAEVFDMTDAELQRIQKKLKRSTDFYKTYDSLGGVPDMIREPKHSDIWEQLISGGIRGDDFRALRDSNRAS
ncbi:MAG: hypothetical protein WC489_05160 [Patescibacteria group bacterium]